MLDGPQGWKDPGSELPYVRLHDLRHTHATLILKAGVHPKIEAAVMNVMNQHVEAYAKRDLDALLSLFAPDPDVVFIGTGGDEKRIGLAEIKAQFERDFAQSETVSVELGWISVSAAPQPYRTDQCHYDQSSPRNGEAWVEPEPVNEVTHYRR